MKKIKELLVSPQNSIMSAASLIMFMIVASRVLGLVRQRILAHFFVPSELSLFFAAFRLPDTVFEVLVFGTFSSAFIPVFTKELKINKNNAWKLGGLVINWGMLAFATVAIPTIILAKPLYGLITPGFNKEDIGYIATIARILFAAQGFFVFSYVLTAVLESSRRFLVPALAPLFYNLGIIVFTILFSSKIGLMAPVVGVVIGAFLHSLVQLPLAIRLGFKFLPFLKITPEIKKVVKLALPRILEVSFLQIAKFVELGLATLISVPAYTYFTFGNSIQLIPVGLFGTSIAKAALPTLSSQTDNLSEFKKTLFQTLNQVVFLMAPISAFLIVARVPVVRLVFGTDLFTWDSTVQTSLVLSAFAVGVFSQASNSILARSFYALHDTKTPVFVSIGALVVNIILDYIFVVIYNFPVWILAAVFSFASIVQSVTLFLIMVRKIDNGVKKSAYLPIIKSLSAAFISGSLMFLFLKFFDRSVWIKKLSFIANANLPFEKFVLDTRYTANLILLTAFVGIFGILVYVFFLVIFKSEDLSNFVKLVKKMIARQRYTNIPIEEEVS